MESRRVLRKRKGNADLKATMASSDQLKRQRTPTQKCAVDPNAGADSCVAVETIAYDVEGRSSFKQAQVNLLSHCIFCLRKMDARDMDKQPSEETLQTVPRAQLRNPSPVFLLSFNRTWSYLENKMGKGSRSENKQVTKFLNVPDMCTFCADKIETVHKLYAELETQLDALKKIVDKSSSSGEHSWRTTLKSSNLSRVVLDATLHLLHTFGRNPDLQASDPERSQVDDDVPSIDESADSNEKFFVSVSWKGRQNSRPRSDHQGKQLDEAENESASSSAEFSENIDSDANGDDEGELLGEEEAWDNSDMDPGDIKSEPESEPSDREMSTKDIIIIFPSDPNTQATDVEKVQTQENMTSFTSNNPETKEPVSSNLNHCDKCDVWRERLDKMAKLVKWSVTQGQDLPSKSDETLKVDESNARKESQLPAVELENSDDDARGGNSFDENDVNATNTDSDSDCIKSEPKSDSSEEKSVAGDNEMSTNTNDQPGSSELDRSQEQSGAITIGERETEAQKQKVVSSKVNRTSGASISCDVCGKKFLRLASLQRHKLTAQCDKTGSARKRKRVGRRQLCDMCNVRVSIADIHQHVRDHVGEEYLLKCPNPQCPHVYSKITSLQNHFRGRNRRAEQCRKFLPNWTEYLESLNTCQVCGYKSPKFLYGHLLRLHEDSAQINFACPVENCTRQFTLRQSVAWHIIQHDATNMQKCSECGSMLKFDKMEKHLKASHGAVEIFKCSYCPFLFSTREFMLDHLHEHRSHGLLSCDICGNQEKFYKLSRLREHYFSKHSIGRNYPCADCGHVSWTQNDATAHAKKDHGGGNGEDGTQDGRVESQKSGEVSVGSSVQYARKQRCDLCFVKVPLAEIHEHVRAHIGEECLFKCPNPKCPHVYSNTESLRRHLQDKNLKERQCRKFVPNLREFMESFNVCHVCGHKATSFSSLRGHLFRVHEKPNQKNFSCPVENCPHKFTVRQSVVCHLHKHKALPEMQSCPQCSSTFKYEEMEEHLKEAHGAPEMVQCNHCPSLFSNREAMLDHLGEHKRREGLFSCDICGDEIKYRRCIDLREHYFNKHGIGQRFSCSDCGHISWTADHAAAHTKEKHDLAVGEDATLEKGHKCDYCDAAFNHKDSLKSHKIRFHGAEPYICNVCSATFSRSGDLACHERKHGGGQLPEFSCDVEGCGKVFKQKKGLQEHVSYVHLGQKHVCELCGRSYASSTGLRNHKTSFHLGIRKFVCETCGESFTSGGLLRRHNMIHTGARPLTCEICGQRFRTTNVLKTHLESHRKKGADFKPTGPMKHIRKRVERKSHHVT